VFDEVAARPAAPAWRDVRRAPRRCASPAAGRWSFMLEPPFRREAGGSCRTSWSSRSAGARGSCAHSAA